MKCPNCAKESLQGEPECPACGLIFEKWLKKTAPPETPPVKGGLAPAHEEGLRASVLGSPYFFPAATAAVIALAFAFNFIAFLPLTEGWAKFERVIFPLTMVNLVIHEAGHPLLGIFGNEFLMTAGGTIFQVAFPLAFFAHFLVRENKAGCLFTLFWTGYSLVNASFYMADADIQALILITGQSGREGGLHDWNYLFTRLGLLKQCIAIARMVFFCGVCAMWFAPLAGLKLFRDARVSKKQAP